MEYSIIEKQKTAFKALKDTFGYKNVMQTPKIQKVIVNVGVGSTKDKNKIPLIADRLAKITGQKPSNRPAKKSIATFKVREGDLSGYQVTMRGKRAADFLNKVINIALPRTKDFRGLSNTIDAMGNYTFGIKEHTIFPETSDEDLKDVFGMAVTVVTSAKTKEEAKKLLEHLGFPFKNNVVEKSTKK